MTAVPTLPEIKIDPHASADDAREFLERDRLLAAYALADIDQPHIEGARWWVGRRDGEIQAVVLVVEGLPFRPCFATGSPEALATIFREAIHEPRVLLATPPRGRLAIEQTYRFERLDRMKRMAVNVHDFRPRLTHRVTRLGSEDLDSVIDLYGHASRTYFTPERMRREIYFGIYQGDTLVSAAGTHVRSIRSGIAAVGNVLTRLAYRGRGMATSCTWAAREMPVLSQIRERFTKERPFVDLRIGACLHVTAETANLMLVLRDGGARVALCASNPLSTQDDVAAALVANEGIAVFAKKGEGRDTYYAHISSVLETRPQITMDDGADVATELHTRRRELLPEVRGGTEETTTGVTRLRAMASEGVLAYPIVAVNDALTKHLFDNRYGTGQSAVDGILRATNLLLAGKIAVVAGYGWVGRGIATRLRGMGSILLVVEVDPLLAPAAATAGFEVTTMAAAAARGDLFVTATGNVNVIGCDAIGALKDGAIVANAGHFNDEIDLQALGEQATGRCVLRPFVEEYTLRDGLRVVVLGEGRLVNLAAAEGHPPAVMDMSFANRALAIEYLVKRPTALAPQVYPVPRELDEEIARRKLDAMGMKIDSLTSAQAEYSRSWKAGT